MPRLCGKKCMSIKRAATWIGLLTSSGIVLCANQAQAYTFSTNIYRPADVIDYRAMDFTYDTTQAQTPGITRVRKSAAELSDDEIDRFVNALMTVKTERFVTTANGIQISEYDQFVAAHLATMDITGRPGPDGNPMVNGAHGNDGFLPWHRAFLYEFEELLQTVDPTVTIPYWDWTLPTAVQQAEIFTADFMGGFGAGGVQGSNFSTANGWVQRTDLSGNTWNGLSTGTQALARPARNATNRSFATLGNVNWTGPGGFPAGLVSGQEAINRTMSLTTYATFNFQLERRVHNPQHTWIGGSMGTQASPNDPMFWLLHANVDRLWAEWQMQDTDRLDWTSPDAYSAQGSTSYGHNLLDPMFLFDGGQSSVAADLQMLLPRLPGANPPSPTALDPNLFMLASTQADLMVENTQYVYNPWGHDAYHGDLEQNFGRFVDETTCASIGNDGSVDNKHGGCGHCVGDTCSLGHCAYLSDLNLSEGMDHSMMDHGDTNYTDHDYQMFLSTYCNQDENVPEPVPVAGIVTLGLLGVGSLLKRKQNLEA